LSIIQAPFSVAPWPYPNITIRNFFIAEGHALACTGCGTRAAARRGCSPCARPRSTRCGCAASWWAHGSPTWRPAPPRPGCSHVSTHDGWMDHRTRTTAWPSPACLLVAYLLLQRQHGHREGVQVTALAEHAAVHAAPKEEPQCTRQLRLRRFEFEKGHLKSTPDWSRRETKHGSFWGTDANPRSASSLGVTMIPPVVAARAGGVHACSTTTPRGRGRMCVATSTTCTVHYTSTPLARHTGILPGPPLGRRNPAPSCRPSSTG
jgi:hypothetical protein